MNWMSNKLWTAVLASILFISILACSSGDDDEVSIDRPDNATCGGVYGESCADPAESCYFDDSQSCGADQAVGTCGIPPEICTREYMPVCGCDGRTYGNRCEARGAGTSVQSDGPCPTSGQICGTRGASPCPDGEVCIYEESALCGSTDLPGTCQLRPDACPMYYQPVCGCDGNTYGNSCVAAAAGASVKYQGECLPSDAHCSRECTEDEYCPLAQGCAIPTSLVSCQTRPQACTMQYDPVCGCDGRTYGNACSAANHGISVAHAGECGATR